MLALSLIAGRASCQEKIDIEKEKEAIKAVIEEESNSFIAKDFDRFAATYVQDETNIRLSADKSGYGYYVGWEEIGSGFKEFFENNPEPGTGKFVKTNYKIKVYKESAWAVHDGTSYDGEGEVISKNIGVRFQGQRILKSVNGLVLTISLQFLTVLDLWIRETGMFINNCG